MVESAVRLGASNGAGCEDAPRHWLEGRETHSRLSVLGSELRWQLRCLFRRLVALRGCLCVQRRALLMCGALCSCEELLHR